MSRSVPDLRVFVAKRRNIVGADGNLLAVDGVQEVQGIQRYAIQVRDIAGGDIVGGQLRTAVKLGLAGRLSAQPRAVASRKNMFFEAAPASRVSKQRAEP